MIRFAAAATFYKLFLNDNNIEMFPAFSVCSPDTVSETLKNTQTGLVYYILSNNIWSIMGKWSTTTFGLTGQFVKYDICSSVIFCTKHYVMCLQSIHRKTRVHHMIYSSGQLNGTCTFILLNLSHT